MHPAGVDGCTKAAAAGALQDPQAAEGYFGFPVDNTIGGTPQYNGWMNNWVGNISGSTTKWAVMKCISNLLPIGLPTLQSRSY